MIEKGKLLSKLSTYLREVAKSCHKIYAKLVLINHNNMSVACTFWDHSGID